MPAMETNRTITITIEMSSKFLFYYYNVFYNMNLTMLGDQQFNAVNWENIKCAGMTIKYLESLSRV